MKDRKNGEEPKRDQGFMARLLQETRSEKYQKMREHVRKGNHPTRDLLYDYVTGDLNDEEAGIVRKHLLFCEMCTDEVARLMRIEQHVDEELEKWAEQADTVSTPEEEEEEKHTIFVPGPGFAPATELPGVATTWWWPQLAQTAAVTNEEEHRFVVGDGEITLLCYWQGEYRDKPPFIRITWNADISVRSEIWVHFATQQAQAEFCLGAELSGEDFFTNQDLGFDPSVEQWRVALALKEVGVTIDDMPPLATKAGRLEEIVTDLCEFEYAGQVDAVAAAGIPEQEHRFFIEEGEIRIHCYWGEAKGTEPAYIWLSWDANIETEKVFYARFVNPENATPHCEIRLGTDLTGEETFTSEELGFDPAHERWAIAIVLRESTK